jgi:ribosomal protein L21
MAKLQVSNYKVKAKVKRKGIHAKTKFSKLKSSKNYKKTYRGQGR